MCSLKNDFFHLCVTAIGSPLIDQETANTTLPYRETHTDPYDIETIDDDFSLGKFVIYDCYKKFENCYCDSSFLCGDHLIKIYKQGIIYHFLSVKTTGNAF